MKTLRRFCIIHFKKREKKSKQITTHVLPDDWNFDTQFHQSYTYLTTKKKSSPSTKMCEERSTFLRPANSCGRNRSIRYLMVFHASELVAVHSIPTLCSKHGGRTLVVQYSQSSLNEIFHNRCCLSIFKTVLCIWFKIARLSGYYSVCVIKVHLSYEADLLLFGRLFLMLSYSKTLSLSSPPSPSTFSIYFFSPSCSDILFISSIPLCLSHTHKCMHAHIYAHTYPHTWTHTTLWSVRHACQ